MLMQRAAGAAASSAASRPVSATGATKLSARVASNPSPGRDVRREQSVDVVDQHVDPVGQLGHLLCGAKVAAHSQVVGGQEAGLAARNLPAQEFDGGRTPGLVVTGNQHVVAGGDQPSRNVDADAARGAGHHRDHWSRPASAADWVMAHPSL
jgi:hypothetical protein